MPIKVQSDLPAKVSTEEIITDILNNVIVP